MVIDSPPAYAWDWLARQRVAWREVRRRLLTAQAVMPGPRGRPVVPRPAGDVPDWSLDHRESLPDHVRRTPPAPPPAPPPSDAAASSGPAPHHDYTALDTRAEVIAALREDYAAHDAVRRTVDAVVAEVAFLGRLDVPLHQLGVRHAPRGMRWWWCHLGGTGLDDGGRVTGDAEEPSAILPTQLRLVDVLSGYGDGVDV
jgi:hypothetical protein